MMHACVKLVIGELAVAIGTCSHMSLSLASHARIAISYIEDSHAVFYRCMLYEAIIFTH